jgi:hypothetical protein
MAVFLEFEKPIADLEGKIEEWMNVVDDEISSSLLKITKRAVLDFSI